MRQVVVSAVAGMLLMGSVIATAAPQETQTARGAVTAVGKDSVTVMVKDQAMKFLVDGSTEVVAPGGGTKARAAKAEGRSGASVGEVLAVGQAVEVKYHMPAMHAANIRVLPGTMKASADGPAAEAKVKTLAASGTVTSVTGSSLVVKTSAGESTFVVDTETKVVGSGLGTKGRQNAAAGKKSVITDLVATGDAVSVSYHQGTTIMHAAEVRLTHKAAK